MNIHPHGQLQNFQTKNPSQDRINTWVFGSKNIKNEMQIEQHIPLYFSSLFLTFDWKLQARTQTHLLKWGDGSFVCEIRELPCQI